jgi:hypothetical protein
METLHKAQLFPAPHSPFDSGTPGVAVQPGTASLPATAAPLAVPRFSISQLYTIWEAMKQRGGLYLLHGDPYVLELAQKMLSRPLLKRTPVVMVDGNNSFHLYLYTRMAQYFARRPEDFLRPIKISRAFTCHQMVSLMERVSKAAEHHHAPLVVVLGPLSTFGDENVPVFEANKLFKKMERILRDLAHRGLKVVLACPEIPQSRQQPYLESLKRNADFRLSCERPQSMELLLRLERPKQFQQVWTLPSNAPVPLRYSRQLMLFQ